jgi:hypothetical protein
MSAEKWEVLAEIYGELQAEIIRGLLESEGIEVYLNQEGASRAYAVNVGPLGKVQVLVPSSQIQIAQQILQDYHAGKYESSDGEIQRGEEDTDC